MTGCLKTVFPSWAPDEDEIRFMGAGFVLGVLTLALTTLLF